MNLNSKQKQKIEIMRQAEVNIGAALLSAVEMLKVDLMAYLSDEIATLKTEYLASISQLEQSFADHASQNTEDVAEIKLLVEEINDREIDEDAIVESLAEKIVIPTPINGHTPTKEELLKIIAPLIPQIENGTTPTRKELLNLIRPLIPKVENGRPPSEEELIDIIRPLIPEIQLPDFEKLILDILNTTKIDASQVRNLPKSLRNPKGLKNGGGDNVMAGTGITITVNSDGSKIVSSSNALGTTWHNDSTSNLTITGTIDGSNKTFTLSATPATNSLEFLWNGIRQSALAGDYSLSGATITMLTTVAPQVGDILEAKYTT